MKRGASQSLAHSSKHSARHRHCPEYSKRPADSVKVWTRLHFRGATNKENDMKNTRRSSRSLGASCASGASLLSVVSPQEVERLNKLVGAMIR